MTLTSVPDDELVSHLEAICVEGHQRIARLLGHLIEVDVRRLHLKAACRSLFDFCLRRLGMSEGCAFRRINAARLVRRFPGLLARIERGEIHLSALVLLRDHLTKENVEELAAAVAGKSTREIEELLARRFPRPDVPSTLRRLPSASAAPAGHGANGANGANGSTPAASPWSPPTASARGGGDRARIEPLSEGRYKLQLTASTELRDKLERARDLMRHRNPSGDLAVVVERAVDALLEKLEKEILAKATRPERPVRAAKPGVVTCAARRAVFERDGEQCSFVDGEGHRCPARGFLEVDHVESRALGGSGQASNLRILCRAHNRLHADQVFGADYVADRIHFRQRKWNDAPASSASLAPPVALAAASTSVPPVPLVPLPIQDEQPMNPAVERREAIDIATRGLVGMGFPEKEARRALAIVAGRHAGGDVVMPPADMIREALRVLT